jgi:hypothetical protein
MYITLYPFNLLALSGSIVAAPTGVSGYPATRLYDRSIDFYYKTTSTFYAQVDQGAAVEESIDFLAISRHNLDADSMQWQWSDNGSAWTDAVTDWTQSGYAQIIKTLDTALSHRYWKVTAGANANVTEVWMSRGYRFRVVAPDGPEGTYEANVDWRKSYGDVEISRKRGSRRRIRTYPLFHHETAESTLANFREAISYLDHFSKPFYIKDHEGEYWPCRLEEPSVEEYTTPGTTDRQITVIEQL